MVRILETKSLYYKDVNLIAQPSVVRSRKEIPIEGWRIVVSAMSSIVGYDFIKAVGALPAELQPTIHIPRVTYIEWLLRTAKEAKCKHVFVGVGIDTPEIEKLALELGFQDVLLDVANGDSPSVKEAVTRLSKKFHKVVVGSVSTTAGYIHLADAGARVVRSGLGSGNVCSTKEMTGFTRGTFSELLDLKFGQDTYYGVPNAPKILADGGFVYPSDIVKAFGAGADYIMSGKLFVNAKESELRVTGVVERRDVYFGMASKFGKEDMGKPIENIEGKIKVLPRDELKPLKEILEDLWMAIRSGVSYGGYSKVSDFIGNGVFEIVHDIQGR